MVLKVVEGLKEKDLVKSICTCLETRETVRSKSNDFVLAALSRLDLLEYFLCNSDQGTVYTILALW